MSMMKYKENISPIVLILFVINLSCVETRRLNNIESRINDLHNEKVDSRILKLDTINSFEWDELIIASPYENLDDIEPWNLHKELF